MLPLPSLTSTLLECAFTNSCYRGVEHRHSAPVSPPRNPKARPHNPACRNTVSIGRFQDFQAHRAVRMTSLRECRREYQRRSRRKHRCVDEGEGGHGGRSLHPIEFEFACCDCVAHAGGGGCEDSTSNLAFVSVLIEKMLVTRIHSAP